jgi:7,8-dihydropterin-6-yl-methyl-4-(beta-D-ribofuranosyl)aminobenzene 5'-phosphate synthase
MTIPTVLDELGLLVVIDNETDILSSVPAAIPRSSEVVHLLGHTAEDTAGGTVVFDKLCYGCHGLSVLLTGRSGSCRHTVLFDVGPDGHLWLDNAAKLGVVLADIDVVFLSHWHFDHSGGLPVVLGALVEARSAAGRPPPILDLHPAWPRQRGIILSSGQMMLFPPEPTIDELGQSGVDLRLHADAHALGDGMFYASGFIARATTYETGLEGHVSIDATGAVRADPLIADERFVAAHVRGRGVSVVSACSHAGIVNACLAAKAAFPGSRVDLVLGGYHLAGIAMERRIASTVDDLLRCVNPRIVAPGHCTGWRATAALAGVGFDGYAPSSVGAYYHLQQDP